MRAMTTPGVKAEAVAADEPHAAVEALDAPVGEFEADRGEAAGVVVAQRAGGLDERLELERAAQPIQAFRCAGARARSLSA
jgi:hypothetical protein